MCVARQRMITLARLGARPGLRNGCRRVIKFHSMHSITGSTSTIWSLGSDTWATPCNRVPRGALSMAALRNSTWDNTVYHNQIIEYVRLSQDTSGATRSRIMNGRESMRIFILSPVSFALSLPFMHMS